MIVQTCKRWVRLYGPFLLLSVFLVTVWEIAVRQGRIPAFILPAPSSVLKALIEQRTLLLGEHLPATLLEVLVGFTFSACGGTLLGIAMHRYRPVERALYPFLILSQTLPLIALSPVFLMWFGYTLWSKVAVVFLTAFFPVVVGTFDGLHKQSRAYEELLLTLGASRRQILVKTAIPLALPSFFSGLKLAMVYSVIGATLGEWLGGSRGLGYYSRRMAGNLQTDRMFAAVLLLSMLGISLFMLISLTEKLILKKRGAYP